MSTSSAVRRFAKVSSLIASLLPGTSLACDSGTPPPAVHAPATLAAIRPGAAERLAGAVRIPTISNEDTALFNAAPFDSLHAFLQREFPAAHSALRREVIGGHSLLLMWPGTDPSLKPILLMAHMDVVPVEPGTEKQWEQQPFAGTIADGFIWGRGAIDNKSAVVGTLEAVEMLLADGFQPARTVYLAYGHDEEVGGTRGARHIAAALQERGVELELVLDEGGVIGDGLMPGVSRPTALMGIAEKGFVSVELSARAAGGHSSLPARESVIGIVGAAVARLEENQMPARFDGPTRQLFEQISPEFPFARRAIFANVWLTRPLVLRKLQETPTTNAMVRTTTAATMFTAGTKENVLASHARAVVNFRIHPGDSIAGVLTHVRNTVDDQRVEVRVAPGFTAEPSAVTRTDTDIYRTVQQTIQSLAPSTIVAPYLVVVVTDARYFAQISDNILRFLPVRLEQADLQRMHGTNERLSIEDYEWAIRFYRELILNAARPH